MKRDDNPFSNNNNYLNIPTNEKNKFTRNQNNILNLNENKNIYDEDDV